MLDKSNVKWSKLGNQIPICRAYLRTTFFKIKCTKEKRTCVGKLIIEYSGELNGRK